jgi:hypothetical protein
MKDKILLVSVIFSLCLIPLPSFASDWMIFTPKQKDGSTWFYDKNSISYPKNISFIGIPTPMRDRNFQKMWIKSSSDIGEQMYQIEINCRDRSAKMQDSGGKQLYSLNSIYYLYDRPIPPDTVLDMLQKAICR